MAPRSLTDVISTLDAEVLHVVRPGSAAAEVYDVVILDPSDPGSVGPGTIVLAIGMAESERDALAVVDRAGRAGVPAVVFRTGRELPATVRTAADAHELALLTVPPEMPWGQVYSLLRTAVTITDGSGAQAAAGVALGDLFALADAIAASVGGPVTIEDPQARVLAFSNLGHEIDEARRETILGRGVSKDWMRRLEEAGVLESLRSGTGVVRFDGDEAGRVAPRLAAPVRAGAEVLGAIWVAQSEAPLDGAAEDALARAAQVAAIHLVYHRASDDLKRRTRGAYVREVLDGHVPHEAAIDSPLRATGPFMVLVFAVDGDAVRRDPDRILSVVSLYCEDAHPDAMCAAIGDRFWALLPTPGGRRSRGRDVAERVVERVESVMDVRLLAGIGGPVARIGDVPQARRAAAQALTVLMGRGGDVRVADIEEVRAHAVLLDLLRLAEEHPGLLAGKVADLIAHDVERGTGHVATLRAYLDAWGDMAQAARQCGVHVNTMRYRVRKIVELSGLELGDPDERLVTELQLRLHAEAQGTQVR